MTLADYATNYAMMDGDVDMNPSFPPPLLLPSFLISFPCPCTHLIPLPLYSPHSPAHVLISSPNFPPFSSRALSSHSFLFLVFLGFSSHALFVGSDVASERPLIAPTFTMEWMNLAKGLTSASWWLLVPSNYTSTSSQSK